MFPDDPGEAASACGDGQNFSMRDYVLAARKKDISHNWPFPRKYLQMFMEHGVSKVLPPFGSHHLPRDSLQKESLSMENLQEEKACASASVIHNNFMSTIKIEGIDEHGKRSYIEEAIAYVSEHVSLLSLSTDRDEHKKGGCLRRSATKFEACMVENKLMLPHELLEASSFYQDISFKVSDARKSVVFSMLELQEPNEVDDFIIHDKSVVGNGIDLNSTLADENSGLDMPEVNSKASNSFANTSLPSGKISSNKRRRKGKPKKRTMADICARARPSTLEDLDRLNGSNWANDSSLMPYNCPHFKENMGLFNKRSRSLSSFDEPTLQVVYSVKKHLGDESLNENYLLAKKRHIMLKKLEGMPKSRKRKLSSLATENNKDRATSNFRSEKS